MNNALYNQIRIFQSIAREGNISAAARKLEITPSGGYSQIGNNLYL